MVTLLLAATLAAQPAPAPTVAVTTPVKKTAADYANAQRLLEPLREALRQEGFTVLTAEEVRSRAPATSAADCGRNRTCLALFAGALEVDWLVTLETEAVEKDLAVAISALSPQRDERPEMTFFTLVNARDLEERVKAFAPRLASIVRQYGGFPNPPAEAPVVTAPPLPDAKGDGAVDLAPPPDAPKSASKVNVGGIASAGAAVALVGGGAYFLNDARTVHADLTSDRPRTLPYTARETDDLVRQGKRSQVLGLVGVGLGAAAAATSVFLFTQGSTEPETSTGVSVSAGPSGVAVFGSF